MKMIRKFAGFFLVVIAVLMLVGWEVRGREMVLMDEMLVARSEISVGETLSPSMFRAVSIPKDAALATGLRASQVERLNGRVTTVTIPQNGQVAAKYLRRKTGEAPSDQSFFVIRKEWIFMRSSALRRGDYVDIVSAVDGQHFGRFKAAFVKNAEEEEVTESTGGAAALAGGVKDRVNGSSRIDHIEIGATGAEYMKIKAFAEGETEPSLILIQRENDWTPGDVEAGDRKE
jgi:hypothetical protein